MRTWSYMSCSSLTNTHLTNTFICAWDFVKKSWLRQAIARLRPGWTSRESELKLCDTQTHTQREKNILMPLSNATTLLRSYKVTPFDVFLELYITTSMFRSILWFSPPASISYVCSSWVGFSPSLTSKVTLPQDHNSQYAPNLITCLDSTKHVSSPSG